MDVLKAIMTRRSVRKFKDEVISNEQLDTILRAGFQSPSAHDMQPWNFVVIRDREVQKKFASFHKYAQMLPKASYGIVVCGNIEKQPIMSFLVEDCSASIQNMLLAIHGLGLGGVWCGIYDSGSLVQSTKELLELPENIIPIGMVVVGVKDDDRLAPDRFDEKKIHYDKW